jgi:hypothetical protein
MQHGGEIEGETGLLIELAYGAQKFSQMQLLLKMQSLSKHQQQSVFPLTNNIKTDQQPFGEKSFPFYHLLT